MAHCASCGSEVASTGRFCAACGAAVENSDSFATRTVATSTPRSATPRDSRTTSLRHSSARSQGRFAPGELLGGRYRIVAMLGKGGMGEVYRADDLTLDQSVALKFLPEAVAQNELALERFRNEVRIARQVSHPNVCRVYDLGEMQGLYFLSMEYVDGEDLGSLLRRIGRLPTDKALEIARKLCAGLAAAHEKGVLHRDLKPANVMLDGRGQVLLTDFGLAGLAGQIEGAEVRNGTPAYMAPEQLAGDEVTIRSDIYALGLVLYEIFTGRLPFETTTLAGLIRAQRESVPVSPSSLVRDLDPMVERVILRCLNAKPAARPASALAVAAALPGGDPLAAALAAGETPSPEMVAAAGEGEGLSLRAAVLLLVFVLVGTGVSYGLQVRSSALALLAPEYGPEVMAQKSRDLLQKLGVTGRAVDSFYAFDWEREQVDYFRKQKPFPGWKELFAGASTPLVFWYRQSPAPLTGVMFHDDLLTPGVISWGDPPPIESGMARLVLDSRGRLRYFDRIPPQKETAPAAGGAVDWGILFAAAGLDQSHFQPAEPLWNSLSASDARVAWSTDTPRPQRVEAASWRGQPVFFSIVEPWTKPDRMPGGDASAALVFTVLSILLVVICGSAGLLAARHLRQQRGDRRGAFRLGAFVACMQMALWLARAHIQASSGTFGTFLIAMCTSIFYGMVIWTVYMALEPYVRRRWPQTLISWSNVLIGRVRDAVVGRDVLIGCATGVGVELLANLFTVWSRHSGAWSPDLSQTGPLSGLRGALATVTAGVPHAIREALFFFFLIFLLRVVLRNQWLAAAAFALLLASLDLTAPDHPLFVAGINFAILSGLAFVVLRWGILAIATALLFSGAASLPVAADTSAWYFGGSAFVLLLSVALAGWAFHASLGGRKLWKDDLFG